MSDDLLRQLRELESEYAGQPRIAQQADLPVINRLRAQLGLPAVDAQLKEIGVAGPVVAATPAPEPVAAPDHTEARALYHAYLAKVEELEVHRAYAQRVVKATAGHGQTPVRPLATMGPNGGPLLCDQCHKPMLLEGGDYHGLTADVAWQRHGGGNWVSWILGGMVVELTTNGTLRIYHGYPGQDPSDCCNVATRERKKARTKRKAHPGLENYNQLLAFLDQEFPAMPGDGRLDLLNKILTLLSADDPGIGVNRPDAAR